MGVRTRPGIKHGHGHNQQREALAEQHRDGTGPVLSGGRTVLGLRQRHCPLPRDGMGHGLAPLPGWMLGFGQGQRLLFPPGCRVLGPLKLTQPQCPGTGQHVPLVRWPCRVVVLSPMGAPKIMAFSFFFFLLFWQQTYPSRCSGESKTVHRGLLPCRPLRTGVRAEVLLWGRDCGQEPDLGPSAQSNPLAGASNLGYWTPCHPPEPSHGASVGVPGGGAENGHSSMPL